MAKHGDLAKLIALTKTHTPEAQNTIRQMLQDLHREMAEDLATHYRIEPTGVNQKLYSTQFIGTLSPEQLEHAPEHFKLEITFTDTEE